MFHPPPYISHNRRPLIFKRALADAGGRRGGLSRRTGAAPAGGAPRHLDGPSLDRNREAGNCGSEYLESFALQSRRLFDTIINFYINKISRHQHQEALTVTAGGVIVDADADQTVIKEKT